MKKIYRTFHLGEVTRERFASILSRYDWDVEVDDYGDEVVAVYRDATDGEFIGEVITFK